MQECHKNYIRVFCTDYEIFPICQINIIDIYAKVIKLSTLLELIGVVKMSLSMKFNWRYIFKNCLFLPDLTDMAKLGIAKKKPIETYTIESTCECPLRLNPQRSFERNKRE